MDNIKLQCVLNGKVLSLRELSKITGKTKMCMCKRMNDALNDILNKGE